MKRFSILFLVCLIVFIVSFSAYAASNTTYVTIGTSGTGGTMAIIGSAIAKVVNDADSGIVMNVENTPSGGAGNVLAIGKESIEFGLATSLEPYNAYLGEGLYTEKIEKVRLIATGLPFILHAIVLDNSSIKKLEDIKGKKVAGVGTGGTRMVIDILKACGLEESDYKITIYTLSEACDALKDGYVDILMNTTSLKGANISDLTYSTATRFIDVAEYIDTILDNLPFYTPFTIPAGSYNRQDAEIATISITVDLVTGTYVDDEIVYQVIKAITENYDDLVSIYPNAGYFSAEKQKDNFLRDAIPPIHDGAVKYYKEIGILK